MAPFSSSAALALDALAEQTAYSTVLWDCDGTLLDTIADLAQAGNHVCMRHGWPVFTVEEYKRKVGNGQRVLVQRIVPPELGNDADLLETAYREFCAYYAEHKDDNTRPYPGVLETLRELAEAGVAMGVLTNKNHGEAQRLVAKHFANLLPVVQGRIDGMPAKPEPPMTLALMARLGADPTSTLMVGDTGVDVASGVNAGLATCGVLWGFRDRTELERAGADHIAATPAEVARIALGL